MKGIDMLCVSQASTAICVSMDIEASSSSSSSSSTVQLGGRAIDRHNPIICDGRRSAAPISPKPYHQLQKPKKGSSNSSNNNDQKRKSHVKTTSSSSSLSGVIGRKSKKPADPPGSSRHLLGDAALLDGLSDYHHHHHDHPVLALANKSNQLQLAQDVSTFTASNNSSSSSSNQSNKPPSSNQVVVLRVSLHCKGCEGKVRKHLSRMEGVTSFNIDFAAKKVTVVGDVSPVSVLASISKVKNAQIWTTSVSSPNPTNKHF